MSSGKMKIIFANSSTARRLAYINEVFFKSDSMPEIMKMYPMLYGKSFYRATLAANAIHRMGKDREAFYNAIIHDNQKRIEALAGKEAKRLIQKSGIPLINRYSRTFRAFRKSLIKTYKAIQPMEPVVRKVFGVDLPKKLIIVLTENIHGKMSCKMLYYNAAESAISLTINHSSKTDPGVAISEIMQLLIKTLVAQEGIVKQQGKDGWIFSDAVISYFVPNGMLSESMRFIEKKPISEYMRANTAANAELSEISKRLLPYMEEYYKRFATMTIWDYLRMTEFAEYIKAT
ncbi:MAG: hypothetical protein QXN59_02370 [Candidatus Micrarchaeaceae archaeon]